MRLTSNVRPRSEGRATSRSKQHGTVLHCPKFRLRCSPNLSVRPARRSPHHAIGITGCPSCGGQRTHSASRMRSIEPHSPIKSHVSGANHIAGCPSFGGQRTRSLCRGGFATVATQSQRPQCTKPTARGASSRLRAVTASRSSGAQCEPCESTSLLSSRSLQRVCISRSECSLR
jgi:hypothetical protein